MIDSQGSPSQDQEGPEECSMQGSGWFRKARLAEIEKKTVEESVLEPLAYKLQKKL